MDREKAKLARVKAVSLVLGMENCTLQPSRKPCFSVGLKGVCFVLEV